MKKEINDIIWELNIIILFLRQIIIKLINDILKMHENLEKIQSTQNCEKLFFNVFFFPRLIDRFIAYVNFPP